MSDLDREIERYEDISAVPLTVLKEVKFAIAAMAEQFTAPGSHEKAIAQMAARGMKAQIDWCLGQLLMHGEGAKNNGQDWKPKVAAGA